MTLQELKEYVLSRDPHEIIDCGMDNFDPYIYISSHTIRLLYSELSTEDQVLFDDWETELLENLRSGNGWSNPE